MNFPDILKHSDSTTHIMSVNPQLATLMGLIDELQEQMPEGKYLEAMNALAVLHGVCPIPPPPPVAFVPPEGGVILTQEEQARHRRIEHAIREYNFKLPAVLMALEEGHLWKIVVEEWNKEQNPPIEEEQLPRSWHRNPRWRTDPHVPEIEVWWMSRPAEQKKRLIKNALRKEYEVDVDRHKRNTNPAQEVCPFVSRHAIGAWGNPNTDPRAKWNCVCGSVNILVKNWRQHEVSEKHVKWHEAGRHLEPSKRIAMLDKCCTPIDPATNKPATSVHNCSHLAKYQAKGLYKNILVEQGVEIQTKRIAGMHAKYCLPHHINHPQSANEWICPDLKGKPWEYKLPTEEWNTEPESPMRFYEMKDTQCSKAVDLSPAEVPQIKEDPPRTRASWCRVARRDIYWMAQEDYATFISMEDIFITE